MELPREVLDAHVHFWDPSRFSYAWMSEAAPLQRRFTPRDLRDAGGFAAADGFGCVFVQAECAPSEATAEARWVLELAHEHPELRGLVVRAALERGATHVRDELAPLREDARVVGVRRLIQWESDPQFCIRPDFIAATRFLGECDLVCDLCVFAPQLPALIELVKACPDVRFVLDHLGKPLVKAGQLDPWRSDLARLAEEPNVACKISGLATEADHHAWTAEQLKPYLDHAFRCFGTERLIFGSDWPVATLAVDYQAWLRLVTDWSASWSAPARTALFCENAVRIYRLPSSIKKVPGTH